MRNSLSDWIEAREGFLTAALRFAARPGAASYLALARAALVLQESAQYHADERRRYAETA